MKRLLLTTAVLGVVMSSSADASILSISGFGGFIEDSAGPYTPNGIPLPDGAPTGSPEGFPEADANPADIGSDGTLVDYFGCVDGVCTSFAWGTPIGSGGPFGGKSGASINLGAAWGGTGGIDPGADGTGGAFGDDSDNDTSRSPTNDPAGNSVVWDPNLLGAFLPIGSLTHFNEPINGDHVRADNGAENGFVGKVGVDYEITVEKSDGGSTVDSQTFSLLFDLVFFETLNSLTGDDCPTGVTTGGCADSFQFFGDTVQTFNLDGETYSLELIGFCTGLDANGAPVCPNEDGVFISTEGGTNTGIVFELKKGVPVPAPTVLALLSAGLIGLGALRRRQAKAAA